MQASPLAEESSAAAGCRGSSAAAPAHQVIQLKAVLALTSLVLQPSLRKAETHAAAANQSFKLKLPIDNGI